MKKKINAKSVLGIIKLCQEIAELKLGVDLETEKKQEYEAKMETPLKMIN